MIVAIFSLSLLPKKTRRKEENQSGYMGRGALKN